MGMSLERSTPGSQLKRWRGNGRNFVFVCWLNAPEGLQLTIRSRSSHSRITEARQLGRDAERKAIQYRGRRQTFGLH